MKIIISGKNMEITSALKNIVEKKLQKLDRYFNPDLIMHATLSVTKNRHIIEVTIPFGGAFLRGEEATDDMYASVDAVVDKIERQIRKQKTKLERRNFGGDSLRYAVIPDLNEEEKGEKEAEIVKTKRFAIKPMSPEEAVLQMELLGHNFFVFQEADSSDVNVVYKRKDGNYGLIEPEF